MIVRKVKQLKGCTKNSFILLALVGGFVSVPAGRAAAQTFANLHSFAPITGYNFDALRSIPLNSDGCYPQAALVLSGKTLYGTTTLGTSFGNGTVFAVNADGSGFTNLHVFAAGAAPYPYVTNSDGAEPYGGLILSGNTLYGTTSQGTSAGTGTVFALRTDGTGFTNLHVFASTPSPIPGPYTNADGAYPRAGLVLSGNTLFGTTTSGGIFAAGTVFAVNTDGTGFTNLHNFSGTNDGANPSAALILSGNTLYGTASGGGSSSNGTIFAVNTDGTGFTNLYNFTGGNDGYAPACTLVLSGEILYGSAKGGADRMGINGYDGSGAGTVFALNTNGTGFTNLCSFTGGPDNSANPYGSLVLSNGILFGTKPFYNPGDIDSYDGLVFAIRTNGTGLTILHVFPENVGVGNEYVAGVILSNYTLYGTTQLGGLSGIQNGSSIGTGSVYSISFLPQLVIARAGTNVVLSWPTNVSVMDTSGFVLQSATNPFSSASWSAVSPSPVVINGQYTVTNPIAGAQMFYRLSQ